VLSEEIFELASSLSDSDESVDLHGDGLDSLGASHAVVSGMLNLK
jgi:hypothetical protein